MNKPIPIQYKKLADECVLELIKTAKKLWPVITELGSNITIKHNNMVIIVTRKDSFINEKEN